VLRALKHLDYDKGGKKRGKERKGEERKRAAPSGSVQHSGLIQSFPRALDLRELWHEKREGGGKEKIREEERGERKRLTDPRGKTESLLMLKFI